MEEAAQQAPAVDQPRRRSLARGCLRTAAGLLLLLILVGVLGAIVLYRVHVSPIKSSEPYRMALELVQKNPKVIGLLGEPIEEVFWPPPSRVENLDGDRGDATLNFEVAGPKGRAAVQTQARMIHAKWGLSRLHVTPVSQPGEGITVDTSETSGLDEAPPFKPGG